MRRNRSFWEMHYAVLQAISLGIRKKTRILQNANINYLDFVEISRNLIESELVTIQEVHGEKLYMLTKKGKDALEIYLSLPRWQVQGKQSGGIIRGGRNERA